MIKSNWNIHLHLTRNTKTFSFQKPATATETQRRSKKTREKVQREGKRTQKRQCNFVVVFFGRMLHLPFETERER